MLDTKTVPDLVNDCRYALDVMEEYSHLGLDNQHASKLRDILLRHSARPKIHVLLLSRKPSPIPIAARDVSFNVVQSFDSRSVKDTADIAEAAHWLTHPDAPARRKTFANQIDQWESEPEWNEQEPPCPEDE